MSFICYPVTYEISVSFAHRQFSEIQTYNQRVTNTIHERVMIQEVYHPQKFTLVQMRYTNLCTLRKYALQLSIRIGRAQYAIEQHMILMCKRAFYRWTIIIAGSHIPKLHIGGK